MQSLVWKPAAAMNASYSWFHSGRPSASRPVTTDFMLSVSTAFGLPRYLKACIIPMNRFSCFAFGKNSMYRCPQWWQTMAKHAALVTSPSAVCTSVKPQSIW